MSQKPGSRLVYGPVQSRRLGRSLGLDLIPPKICSYSCVYCQLGRTKTITARRSEYAPTELILKVLRESLAAGADPDYITMAGSGEPTLHSEIGRIIGEAKRISGLPVAVITNGSLFSNPQVRRACAEADLLMPSLDAGDERVFLLINRPHPDINFDSMLDGQIRLREEYGGLIWLEVMLVAGINDSDRAIESIRSSVELINPDRIQINTVARLPAERWVEPVPFERLEQIKRFLGENAEIIAPPPSQRGRGETRSSSIVRDEILELLRRRPCSAEEMADGLRLNPHELAKELAVLEEEDLIEDEDWSGERAYRLKEG